MRKNWMMIAAGASALALAACGDSSDGSFERSYDSAADAVAETSELAAEIADSAGESGNLPKLESMPVNLPQLAYIYDFAWQMPATDIGKLQRRHASLCEQQGPQSCQILGMRKSGEDAKSVTGQLELAVASRQARAFGALLEDEAEDAGAEQISAEINSEELSKQIVDTEARLEARTELRDRLKQVLRARVGSVEELVEAERSVASVNEEIDAARSWLKEMDGRIAYSRINIRYETGNPVTSDFLSPVKTAVGSLGSILGYLAAILIILGAIALPLGGGVWAARGLSRRFGSKEEVAS
jgi:hypothetical protein